MIDNIKYRRTISRKLWMVAALITSFGLFSCEFELPETGSQPDLTPPDAKFGATQNAADYLTVDFVNASDSYTDSQWDFGDGNSSSEKSPSNTYADIGEYTVTLKVSDKLGAESTITQNIMVEEPKAILPPILEAGFEDNSLPDGTGDGRDSWRTDMGGVIQITSSPVNGGKQAAKFPKEGDRVAYQELTVSPNNKYNITYYYTMKEDGDGNVTVAILGGGITDLEDAAAATLVSNVGTNQDDDGEYVKVDLLVETGDYSTIAILVTNKGVESRVDDFSIELLE